MTDQYLTPAETARLLGISARRVSQLADSGRLPCIRTPLGRLFARTIVRDFAAGRGVALDD